MLIEIFPKQGKSRLFIEIFPKEGKVYIYSIYIIFCFPHGHRGKKCGGLKLPPHTTFPLTCDKSKFFKEVKIKTKMTTEFFMPMKPPTKTYQEKRTAVVKGKTVYYEDRALKEVRAKLTAYLSKHIPDKKYGGAVRLIVKWCFPVCAKHKDGEYKTTKPDTDNLNKMLKDIMTDIGFWKDDAQVASEIIEKFWADMPGIYIRIEELQ